MKGPNQASERTVKRQESYSVLNPVFYIYCLNHWYNNRNRGQSRSRVEDIIVCFSRHAASYEKQRQGEEEVKKQDRKTNQLTHRTCRRIIRKVHPSLTHPLENQSQQLKQRKQRQHQQPPEPCRRRSQEKRQRWWWSQQQQSQ